LQQHILLEIGRYFSILESKEMSVRIIVGLVVEAK